MMMRNIALEQIVLLILAVLILIIGVIIIYRLYIIGAFNIEQTNKTINSTLGKIT